MGEDDTERPVHLDRGPTPEEVAREFFARGGVIVEEDPPKGVGSRIGLAAAGVAAVIGVVMAVLLLTGSPTKSPVVTVPLDPPHATTTTVAPTTTTVAPTTTTVAPTTTTAARTGGASTHSGTKTKTTAAPRGTTTMPAASSTTSPPATTTTSQATTTSTSSEPSTTASSTQPVTVITL